MKNEEMSLEEIHNQGLDALYEELGLSGTIKFIKMVNKDSANYTEKRYEWLPEGDTETVIKEIIARRHKPKKDNKS